MLLPTAQSHQIFIWYLLTAWNGRGLRRQFVTLLWGREVVSLAWKKPVCEKSQAEQERVQCFKHTQTQPIKIYSLSIIRLKSLTRELLLVLTRRGRR